MVRGAALWSKLPLPLVLSVALLSYSSNLATGQVRCDQQTAPGVNCTCDLKSLRPLQGAVGMGEVRQKAEKIKAKPEKEESKLAVNPIKVVRGPDGQLFVTDTARELGCWPDMRAASAVLRLIHRRLIRRSSGLVSKNLKRCTWPTDRDCLTISIPSTADRSLLMASAKLPPGCRSIANRMGAQYGLPHL